MSTHELDSEKCHDTVGTLDIETSGFDGREDHLVAIGVGYYESGGDAADVAVHTQYDADGDEGELIRTAYDWLRERDPDCLTTFNGVGFDFDFLVDKCDALPMADRPDILGWPAHADLLAERKQQLGADRRWPSLDDCLAAYEIPASETVWNGGKLTNTRFGEELAPQYVAALREGDMDALYELEAVTRDYTAADIEATIALYEHDAGREYTPTYAR